MLGPDNAHANIAYHLAILALEEIGKAGMLGARGAVGTALDPEWIEKRLGSHVFKLLWAVWSPSMLSGKVDPQEFESARKFAASTHQRRLDGLYVDYDEASVLTPPRDAVSLNQTTSILGLAKTALDLELARGTPVQDEKAEELVWYLDALNDEFKHKLLFSQTFLKKTEDFGGDARAWLRWARAEIENTEAKMKQRLQQELDRQVEEGKSFKPKWLIKVRLYTPSHSAKQKVLNRWNDRVQMAQLRAINSKKNEILMELHINDRVNIKDLFDFGLAVSKRFIIMLSIGSGGVFWFELSGQTQSYFQTVSDLEDQRFDVRMPRKGGLAAQWAQDLEIGRKRERQALEEQHIEIALRCLAAFGPMSDDEASPIFAPYLMGLTLLCKTDLHLRLEGHARDAFRNALRQAMRTFGDWDGEDASFKAALHEVIRPVIVAEENRNQLFEGLDGKPTSEAAIGHAVAIKWVTDIYLTIVANRSLAELVKGGPVSSSSAP